MQYDGARIVLTNHLGHERDARRQLRVLTQFKVLHEGDTLDHGVLAVKGTIHVRDGTTGDEVRCMKIYYNPTAAASRSTHQ